MSDEEDFFQAISNFIKGKGGPPDAHSAIVSLGEDFDPEAFAPPKISHSFKEFGAEYPVVRNALKKCRFHDCLAILSGMTTLPELQSNAYRLDVLIHLAFIYAKGKNRPQPAQIVAWFNQLDKGTCGRQEDAAEDVFVANVTFEGDTNRVFEGTGEGNRFYTQLFLSIVEHMPSNGPYLFLKNAIRAILRLSEVIADRSGLPAYCVGETVPRAHIGKPDQNFLSEMRRRVIFSHDELASLGISIDDLAPFIIQQDSIPNLADFSMGHTPLEAMTITPSKDGVIVFLPACIGLAVRHFTISYCLRTGMKKEIEEALIRAYIAHFANEGVLKTFPPPLQTQRIGNQTIAQLVKEIDSGRYLHLLFVFDNFDRFEDGSFMTSNDTDADSELIGKCINHAYQGCSAKDGFREGLTIIVPCGWGRFFGAGLQENPDHWRSEMIPSHDLLTLHHTPAFCVLDLLKILDARDRFEALGFGFIYGNGLLNLYGWMVGNDGHIIKHEEFRNSEDEKPVGGLTIPMTCALVPRIKAYMGADIQAIQRPEGDVANLRRVHGSPRYGSDALSPFYADIDAFKTHKFRSVYIGQRNLYWVEATVEKGLDPNIQYQILNMATHWAEFVFKHLDERADVPSDNVILCKLHFADTTMPDGQDDVLTDKEVAALFVQSDITDGQNHRECGITVSEGFLSAERRVDNIAERALAQAIIKASLELLLVEADEQQLVETTQAVVRSDRARHFHAFAVPKARDFVRDDLSDDAIVISRFDDATMRLGLGWMAQDRSAPYKIEGVEACTTYLRKLVQALITKFKSDLALFERGAMADLCLRNHERASTEIDTWKRTFGAVEALSDEAALASKKAIEELGQLNAACLTSRIIVEAALCECPIGEGLVPGIHDVGPLMALASQMHHLGGYSDAIMSRAMPAKIEISAAGEVMMDHGFSDEIITPYGEMYQGKGLASASANYGRHYGETQTKGCEDSASEESGNEEAVKQEKRNEEFAEVWQQEYGFSFEVMQAVWNGLHNILEADRKAVVKWMRSELIARLVKETELPPDTVHSCLEHFTYTPRETWNSAPGDMGDWAWSPWRFQRPLSIVTRPIIQFDDGDDPSLLVAPAMIATHLDKFIIGARTGDLERRLFRENGPMFKWIDRINAETGEAFNEKVAARFREIGWQAQANLSDGQIFNRKKTQGFGDVDVLAWNEAEGRILVIECKDLSMDKTIGEIAKRLEKYQGKTNEKGKKDDLKKHLVRCGAIEAEQDRVAAFVNMEIKQIERVLLFSEPTPLQYSEITDKHNVALVTFAEIAERFGVLPAS
ncbi:hypothetical protein HKX17_16265 [Sulfitobacter sp. KE34]|uniref:hypothetical protein n=1 Tax=unclassified Sulfitobacter TaxID=196795 RepID=UPI0023E185C3|nr:MULTISPECIES: hypothetical protein [unclassified Sulfitobacter]MDF3351704.1 hypothetical protein [Sulfitobacter sp. KE12]MDF3355376.1 hypothetical protein [Sulfitobacter sp. KE27]MDF3359024.1 hypothetical protein [Sulfitobacter sp. KE33]MDF3366448.1 hypothetical protein [Sulfitobacter sp. Ks34]MDF3370057.1 hypothetical protein [Sulfitobacter sp. Ks43]